MEEKRELQSLFFAHFKALACEFGSIRTNFAKATGNPVSFWLSSLSLEVFS
jgi:hypothetical protein